MKVSVIMKTDSGRPSGSESGEGRRSKYLTASYARKPTAPPLNRWSSGMPTGTLCFSAFSTWVRGSVAPWLSPRPRPDDVVGLGADEAVAGDAVAALHALEQEGVRGPGDLQVGRHGRVEIGGNLAVDRDQVAPAGHVADFLQRRAVHGYVSVLVMRRALRGARGRCVPLPP